jgi:hypothetical protein
MLTDLAVIPENKVKELVQHYTVTSLRRRHKWSDIGQDASADAFNSSESFGTSLNSKGNRRRSNGRSNVRSNANVTRATRDVDSNVHSFGSDCQSLEQNVTLPDPSDSWTKVMMEPCNKESRVAPSFVVTNRLVARSGSQCDSTSTESIDSNHHSTESNDLLLDSIDSILDSSSDSSSINSCQVPSCVDSILVVGDSVESSVIEWVNRGMSSSLLVDVASVGDDV